MQRYVGGEINSGATVKDAHEHKHAALSRPDTHVYGHLHLHTD